MRNYIHMVYLLTLVSALTSILGNVTAKFWADGNQPSWFIVTIVAFTASTVSYAYSLRYGHFTTINALFYAVVPIITAIFGYVLFKDKLTTLQLIGFLFGLVSIILLTVEGKVSVPEIR